MSSKPVFETIHDLLEYLVFRDLDPVTNHEVKDIVHDLRSGIRAGYGLELEKVVSCATL